MEPRPARLPLPDPDALKRSETLSERIRAEIAEHGGWIGFDRYMQRVLYEPGLGYYSGGGAKFGAAGDFVTAPQLGDALARALAASLGPWLRSLPRPAILELGAGDGRLAAQLLDALGRQGIGDVSYRILEVSGELRQRQEAALAGFADRVTWLDRLPGEPFDGVIVANEVADALPVACFVKRGGAVPLGARSTEGGFAWMEGPVDEHLAEAVLELEARLGEPLPELYRSEIRLVLPPWIRALGSSLGRGAVLLVDYGYGRRDYYHPQRSAGTLMCHYRHRAHDDPFLYPGLQDITAWVDFSACADAASAAGFSVAGYTTQAQFLIGALGPELLEGGAASASPQALSALKTLVLPGEMGERFKALLLTKDADVILPGRDLRGRLGDYS